MGRGRSVESFTIVADFPKHLVWRCRRGVRELDVLFGRFLQEAYPLLSEKQAQDFERLLEVQDPTIMDWLFEKTICEDVDLAKLMTQLRIIAGLESSQGSG